MKNQLLEQAKQLYPKNTLFLSASGNLHSPIRVTSIKLSEVYKDTIVNVDGGVIYDGENLIWARKV